MTDREMTAALTDCLQRLTSWCPRNPDLVADALPWCWLQLQEDDYGVTTQLLRRALWRARSSRDLPPASVGRQHWDVYRRGQRRRQQLNSGSRENDPARLAETAELVGVVQYAATSLCEQASVEGQLLGEQLAETARRVSRSVDGICCARWALRRRLRQRYPDLCE
jgi:hypothetical protein